MSILFSIFENNVSWGEDFDSSSWPFKCWPIKITSKGVTGWNPGLYFVDMWRQTLSPYKHVMICNVKGPFVMIFEIRYKLWLHQEGHFDPPWEIEGMTLYGKCALTLTTSQLRAGHFPGRDTVPDHFPGEGRSQDFCDICPDHHLYTISWIEIQKWPHERARWGNKEDYKALCFRQCFKLGLRETCEEYRNGVFCKFPSEPFDKMYMTRGQGQWLRVTGNNGFRKVAFLLKKDVCGSQLL